MDWRSKQSKRGGFDRRDFLGIGGAGAAGLFCALSSKDIPNMSSRDLKRVNAAAASMKRPVSMQKQDPVDAYDFDTPDPAPGGTIREYWVQATSPRWNPVPTNFDAWMGMRQQGGNFRALAYQEMESGFSGPKVYDNGSVAKPRMPGPVLEAEVGDVLQVHFRNADYVSYQPVTMHPHGVRYTPDYDGIYLNNLTRAGGFVGPGEEFTYTWECLPDSVGAWPYHDHGPNHVINTARGLFGSIIIREKGEPKPDREFFLHLHSLPPQFTHLPTMLHCINGHAYAGNTPTMRAKVGDKVAIHVFDMNDDFHTFHMHGHRWKDSSGTRNEDSPALGPSEAITIRFEEDNPGRWLYHCHVGAHMMAGMAGWYLVER